MQPTEPQEVANAAESRGRIPGETDPQQERLNARRAAQAESRAASRRRVTGLPGTAVLLVVLAVIAVVLIYWLT